MMNGKYPIVPDWDMGVVDVRDVATLEVLAMTKPEAAGKRFVCSADNILMKDQNNYLIGLYPDLAKRIPTRVPPNWFIKFLSLFMPALKMTAESVGKVRKMDSSRARETLGWKPRTAKEAIKSAAESAYEFDLIKD
jgi:nucleoside-diphosphate-sugar epimerase